jgi:hypothetical protein
MLITGHVQMGRFDDVIVKKLLNAHHMMTSLSSLFQCIIVFKIAIKCFSTYIADDVKFAPAPNSFEIQW